MSKISSDMFPSFAPSSTQKSIIYGKMGSFTYSKIYDGKMINATNVKTETDSELYYN